MVKSLYSGVSGLKTHQQRMDVIGNNIANVNTVGNKADVVTFSTVYFQTKRSPSAANATLGGVNPRQVGYGVQMNTTTANMTQSGYTQSDNKFDMAINGNGFFQVMDGSGNIYYTRAGVFDIDDAGYLVNADGYHVLGIAGDSTGQDAGYEIIRAVVPATEAHASSATKRINGTDVTISVSAPSDHTNMTVTFKDADYPYATYANDILTIFFDFDKQYTQEQEFEDAIAEALQAGGVTLPDDVTLQFDFAEVPSDTSAKTGENSMSNVSFSTDKATAEVNYSYPKTGGGKEYAYMTFAVDDNISTDKVKLKYNYDPKKKGYADAVYSNGMWTLTLDKDTKMSDLQSKIDEQLRDNTMIKPLKVSFVCPDSAKREEALKSFVNQTSSGIQVQGTRDTGPLSGGYSFFMHDAGEFSRNYKITFAYAQGYDNTKAVWDENDLTISICANSTIAEVNKAILDAANGNTKRMMTFTEIKGLSDDPITTIVKDPDNDGKYIVTQTDIYGMTRTAKWPAADETSNNPPTEAQVKQIADADWGNYVTVDGNPVADADVGDFFTGLPDSAKLIWSYEPTGNENEYRITQTSVDGYTRTGTIEKDDGVPVDGDIASVTWDDTSYSPATATEADFTKTTTASGPDKVFGKNEYESGVIWTPGTRDEFFSGNPAIAPEGGEDSFFTGIAKGLDTSFALTDGRTGEDQSFKDFTDITVQQDGRIIGLHPVHGYIEIGRIDIAIFDNPTGLAKIGGTNFQETVASGPAKREVPGQGGAGVVLSGALEMSNVDLADEFTNMITTQRGYQANSRVITVSDTMLEELLSLKR